MKKILIILGSYFPKPSANGICVRQVVKELRKQKIEVTLLASKSGCLKEIDRIDNIDIYRVKARWFHRTLEWYNGKENKKHLGFIRKVVLILNKLKQALFLFTWPLVSPLYTYRYYKKADELYKSGKYDGILSVYAPIDALLAGVLIKKKYENINLMLYFLDTLSGGIPPKGFDRKWLEKRGYKWEKKLFYIADSIFVMKSHEQHYSKKIYNEFKYKIRIVDIPLMRKLNENITKNEVNFNEEKVNIVYTGSLLNHVRNPNYMLKIFSEMTDEFNAHIYGGGDCNNLLKDYINKNQGLKVINHGLVEYEVANNAIIKSNILINIGNITGSLVPSKIFEYMATGKPIISFYRYDDEPSIEYLKKYPLSLLIKEDWNKIDENVQLITDFIIQHSNDYIKYSKVVNIFNDNTAEPLVKQIMESI